ncbi:hypothetical protein L1987_54616 [Smallanthus sonchifolius]|uniref:Uncharacterized protein n=1 Tax=Smallanthus sonchifolius TaxID=185202 RepID=A0ACB9E814_9ASTR|nr:hypothetical protein L1987_54616 [Smallanthus sonchifolius]
MPRITRNVYEKRQKSLGKNKVKVPRCKSVRGPPPDAVLGKRKLQDESSSSEYDEAPAAKCPKLMASAIHAAQSAQDREFVDSLIITPIPSQSNTPHVSKTQDEVGPSTRDTRDERIQALETQVSVLQSQVDELIDREAQRVLIVNEQNKVIAEMQILVSQLVERLNAQGEKGQAGKSSCYSIGIQKNLDDDDEPDAGDGLGERQNVDTNPTSLTQGESEIVGEANMMATGDDKEPAEVAEVDADMLDNSIFKDSDIDDADKFECLLDLDDLSDDEDIGEEELEEGEIVEGDVESDKQKIVYEGCDELINIDVFDDDVIPDDLSEGVAESEESDPIMEKQNPHTAKSMPKDTEMYKNTRMTKAQ